MAWVASFFLPGAFFAGAVGFSAAEVAIFADRIGFFAGEVAFFAVGVGFRAADAPPVFVGAFPAVGAVLRAGLLRAGSVPGRSAPGVSSRRPAVLSATPASPAFRVAVAASPPGTRLTVFAGVLGFEGSGLSIFLVRRGFSSMVLVLIVRDFRPCEDTTSRLRARGRSVAPGLGSLSGGVPMIRDRA